jgi:glutaminyl-peptide cyclotransferase
MNNKTIGRLAAALAVMVLLLSACKSDKPSEKAPEVPTVQAPRFDRDSAYSFVAQQVAFGPRVPNTAAHRACKDWYVERFNAYGATVIEQAFQPKAYTGEVLQATNVIARYNPAATKRIVLAAHWDSRPFADSPLNTERTKDPVLGADDGASGVGVLLEIARQLQSQPLQNIGVDLVLFDAEDYGEMGGNNDQSWGMGAQHWSRNLHVGANQIKYGILLDMVGAKGARFARERISMQYAPQVVDRVWKLAQGLGYGNYFVDDDGGAVMDDHYFVNTIAGVKMIDIINRPGTTETGFGTYWHTHDDNMDIIDARTLRAVGQVLLELLYQEDGGN